MHTKFLSINLKGRELGRPGHRWEDNIRVGLREIGWMWTGFIWLRIGTSSGLSQTL
jgi:hypothetical protein